MYRQDIFETGRRYRVKLTFIKWGQMFTENEYLVFERNAYSPYDSAFTYEFRDASGKLKTWWLGEDEAADLWQDLFEPC